MIFIRSDGNLYNVEHKDTIKRLQKDERFEDVEKITVENLKDYAKKRELKGYSTLTRNELIDLLKVGG
jgi:hypothetical protein